MSVTISQESLVSAVMDARLETVAVFVRNRMHCPGCVMAQFMTLAEAAESHGVEFDAVFAELEAAVSAGREEAAP